MFYVQAFDFCIYVPTPSLVAYFVIFMFMSIINYRITLRINHVRDLENRSRSRRATYSNCYDHYVPVIVSFCVVSVERGEHTHYNPKEREYVIKKTDGLKRVSIQQDWVSRPDRIDWPESVAHVNWCSYLFENIVVGDGRWRRTAVGGRRRRRVFIEKTINDIRLWSAVNWYTNILLFFFLPQMYEEGIFYFTYNERFFRAY